MALSVQEEMIKGGLILDAKMVDLNRKHEQRIKNLSAELAMVKAEVVSKDVALSGVQDELKVSEAALKASEAALKASEETLKGKEVMLTQYVLDAGNMADYYSQDARIQMMEEFNEGAHQAWDLEEAKRQISESFPEGVPGDALLSLYIKLKGPVDDSIDTELEASPP